MMPSSRMHVAIVYNSPADDSAVDEEDVLVQRDAVVAALGRRGFGVVTLPATQRDLPGLAAALARCSPAVVFNLVESLGGSDRGMLLATSLFDQLAFPYTGSSTEAIALSTGKVEAKRRMLASGLLTPAFCDGDAAAVCGIAQFPAKVVIKTIWEHASFGLSDAAIVTVKSREDLQQRIFSRSEELARPCFAEEFIDGREFNLSLLDGPGGPQVLPPAEIDFSAFPPEKPRIVGYEAKWDADTFEYQRTPRRFDFPAADGPLLGELREMALACWHEFGMRGYARVDFRVDPAGRPWILEINANPCLSPDAGFAAALAQAGIEYDEAMERIVMCALSTVSSLSKSPA